MSRQSKVHFFSVNSSSFSSVIQLGDSIIAEPKVKALAVQKEIPIFKENSFPYSDYTIFNRPFLQIIDEPNVRTNFVQHDKDIVVERMRIGSMSSSAITQVGTLKYINAEARIKNIRILTDSNEQEEEENI